MNEGFTRIHMPGYMLRHHRMGHPVMGAIGPRRIAVFIGHAYRTPARPERATAHSPGCRFACPGLCAFGLSARALLDAWEMPIL